jgi:hypothetical protein
VYILTPVITGGTHFASERRRPSLPGGVAPRRAPSERWLQDFQKLKEMNATVVKDIIQESGRVQSIFPSPTLIINHNMHNRYMRGVMEDSVV